MPVLPLESFTRLPSGVETAALVAAAAAAYGADPALVVAAPGTQALIELLPRLRRPGRVAVVGPTYAEHAHAWMKAGHAVEEVASLAAAADSEVVVVVNPNNPDGRTYSRAVIEGAAERTRARGGWLVVDEAFADLEPSESLAPCVPEGVVVLRSFGKAYGLAGVRLGFAVACASIAEELRSALGPWAVSGPAIAVGRVALEDLAWRDAAADARGADALRLDRLFAPITGEPIRGTRLFRTVDTPLAPALFDHLGRAGIWVRQFERDAWRLRFGLPGPAAAWARLEEALGRFQG